MRTEFEIPPERLRAALAADEDVIRYRKALQVESDIQSARKAAARAEVVRRREELAKIRKAIDRLTAKATRKRRQLEWAKAQVGIKKTSTSMAIERKLHASIERVRRKISSALKRELVFGAVKQIRREDRTWFGVLSGRKKE